MSYFRTYFDKNNTIIKDSLVNTAKNPNTELFYGSGFSKFIFRLDINSLKEIIDNGDLVLNSDTKHYLHITNTIFGDEGLLGLKNGKERERTTSFDMILFPITEYWDEGVGYDYVQTYDFTSGNARYDNRPSNWTSRTTLDSWSKPGIYITTATTIGDVIHFDNGDEDIHADITDYINSVITGGTICNGIGLAFHPDYATIQNEMDQSVAFFTKYTQTFFEPYLETVFDDTITDNRSNFIAERANNLYLYVTKGTNFYDLDELPLVDILDKYSTVIPGLEDICAVKVRKGIYKVVVGISGNLCDGKNFFYDVWKELYIDGVSISPVTQKFIPKPYTATYSIGANPIDLERYSVQFFGVKLNEKIKRGDKRKITITFRSISQQQTILFEEVYYRVFIKEGHTQVNVFDWTRLDVTNENSFVLDTSFMIPREYNVEIKAKTHTEEIFYKDEIKFEIVPEK